MTYQVNLSSKAQHDLKNLQESERTRIMIALKGLAEQPRPHGCKKLRDRGGTYRIRVGDYRILYTIHDERRAITVTRIVHRSEAYR